MHGYAVAKATMNVSDSPMIELDPGVAPAFPSLVYISRIRSPRPLGSIVDANGDDKSCLVIQGATHETVQLAVSSLRHSQAVWPGLSSNVE